MGLNVNPIGVIFLKVPLGQGKDRESNTLAKKAWAGGDGGKTTTTR